MSHRSEIDYLVRIVGFLPSKHSLSFSSIPVGRVVLSEFVPITGE